MCGRAKIASNAIGGDVSDAQVLRNKAKGI